jgi:hypothetical protein
MNRSGVQPTRTLRRRRARPGCVSWRWVFFVNVPIDAFAVLLLLMKVAETPRPFGQQMLTVREGDLDE